MKRILDNRKMLNVTKDSSLSELKTNYRNLIKEWHPDKFADNHDLKEQAELKSKSIIDAYHFLVSISDETHAIHAEDYSNTTNLSAIDDYQYKGQTLKITFVNGSVYEYFGVPKSVYLKFSNSITLTRFAKRHIFSSYIYRKALNASAE